MSLPLAPSASAGCRSWRMDMGFNRAVLGFVVGAGLIAAGGATVGGARPQGTATRTLLASSLQGSSGSAVGPGGALYVTEGAAGRLSRVDPETGAITTVAEGLPPALVGIGGAIDVAFIGST